MTGAGRTTADRARGVLLGIAAGDRIGGPVRMALFVAESLARRGGFDPADIGAGYLAWWREGAFDTGPTAARVCALAEAEGIPLEEAALRVDRDTGSMTAGCNPVHRIPPLAMCAPIPDASLASCAKQEAALTHAHALAGDAAAAGVVLCRALIRGADWDLAVAGAAEGRLRETGEALATWGTRAGLSRGGFAPEVLRAAAHFSGKSASFDETLDRAIDFAGPANYCPVLAGALAGARWGAEAIGPARLAMHGDILDRLHAAADALAAGWK
jgi:ADP-ribosylglycohydrolase